MIYEIRTYRLVPGSVAEFERRFGEAYAFRRTLSPLTAFWHSEVGPSNEVMHVWGYADLAERGRIRAEAVRSGKWPPKSSELILEMRTEIVNPFDEVPVPAPGRMGPVFEVTTDYFRADRLPGAIKAYRAAIPARHRLSPLVLAGTFELGCPSSIVHVWAYADMQQRAAARAAAQERGLWPSAVDLEPLRQESRIVQPAAFSPLQ